VQNGEEFVQSCMRAAEGQENPFILVVEGSIFNEENQSETSWATFGTDQKTAQPDHDLPMDRQPRAECLGEGVHGVAGLSGVGLEVSGGNSDCVPGVFDATMYGDSCVAEG
jgi:hypothetical protein